MEAERPCDVPAKLGPRTLPARWVLGEDNILPVLRPHEDRVLSDYSSVNPRPTVCMWQAYDFSCLVNHMLSRPSPKIGSEVRHRRKCGKMIGRDFPRRRLPPSYPLLSPCLPQRLVEGAAGIHFVDESLICLWVRPLQSAPDSPRSVLIEAALYPI